MGFLIRKFSLSSRFSVVRILHVPARAPVRDHLTRCGGDHRVVRHIFDDHAVSPDGHVVTHPHPAENLCAGADKNVVADRGVALRGPRFVCPMVTPLAILQFLPITARPLIKISLRCSKKSPDPTRVAGGIQTQCLC